MLVAIGLPSIPEGVIWLILVVVLVLRYVRRVLVPVIVVTVVLKVSVTSRVVTTYGSEREDKDGTDKTGPVGITYSDRRKS